MNPCVRCGKPSTDHHHGRPENLNMGKGMGGTQHDDSHFVMLDLCRSCHDRAHAKTTVFVVDVDPHGMETVLWHDVGTTAKGSRPLKLALEETDEYLATLWGEAQSLGAQAIIRQAEIANKFRARYGGFDHWWVRVSDIIREVTGLTVSVGVVYDRAALGIALDSWEGDPLVFLELLGVKASAVVGRAIIKGNDPETVINDAMDIRLIESKSGTAKQLKQEYSLGGGVTACEEHTCRLCGTKWSPSETL